MTNILEGVSKDEPIETNEKGGKQSATPYAMHLIDPEFLHDFTTDKFLIAVADFMENGNKGEIPYIMQILQKEECISDYQALLMISKVRKEASAKYPPQNWRLIPQEEHLNHALVHYLAHKLGDKQDEHVEHCLCRLMFAFSTEVSKNFSYTEHIEVEDED